MDLVSLDEFATKTRERATFYRDANLHGRQMVMDETNGKIVTSLNTNGTATDIKTYELLHWGLATLATKLSIPAQYAQRCPEELRAKNFNHWLEQNKGKEFFVRLDSYPDGEEKIRAVLSNKYADFPNETLAKLIRDNADTDYQFMVGFEEKPERLIGELVSTAQKYQSGQYSGGIRIMNSEIGLSKLVLETLLWSRTEKSGIILQEWGGFSEKHLGDKKLFGEKFKIAIDEIMENFGSAMEKLEDLKRVNVEDVPDMLEVISGTNKLKKTHLFLLKSLAAELKPTNLYGVVLLFTKASIHGDMSLEDRELLQRVGGRIVMNVSRYKRWSTSINATIGERSVV